MAAPFSIAGEVFIGLLQMKVLPQIVVSLISNLGGISWSERRSLLVAGIVGPDGANARVPMGYPLPKGDKEWSSFISTWVELERKSGAVDSLFDHWISGGGAQSKEPRWSIFRDVLHWVN